MTLRIHAIVLSLASLNAFHAVADTIHVPGDQPTIAAAISAAGNGDVILIASGLHHVSQLNPAGKAITIQGQPDGSTIVEGDYSGPTFVIESGETQSTLIKDLVIQGGTGRYEGGGWGGGSSNGGRIYVYEAGPRFENCVIRPCGETDKDEWCDTGYIDYGGGAYIHSYSAGRGASFVNCTFTGNEATEGGAIHRGGGDGNTLTLINCTFSGNESYYQGAGLSASGRVDLIGCTISGNEMRSSSYGSGAGIGASDWTTYVHLYDTVVCGNYGTGISVTQISGGYWTSEWNYVSSTCDYPDQDEDGYPDCVTDGGDCVDRCPEDVDKIEPGLCGCGVADTDTDADGTPDCHDDCPEDPLKTAPGDCGCGVADTNVQGDLDCDGDYDAADITLGMDDFGIQSADRNGDGVYDAADVRIAMAEFEIAEAGACPADTNGDGAVDGQDLAAVLANWGLACGP